MSTQETIDSSPLQVGTAYIEAIGNATVHYTFGCVETYEGLAGNHLQYEGVVTNPDGTVTLSYSMTYWGGIQPAAQVKVFPIPIFLPQQDDSGNPILPDFVEVYDKNDPSKKKVGTINKSGPIVRRDVDPNGAPYPLRYPRNLFMTYTPITPGVPDFTTLFVICKNRCKTDRWLALLPATNFLSGVVNLTDDGDNYAAVSLFPCAANDYNSIVIDGQSATIDYTPTPFYV